MPIARPSTSRSRAGFTIVELIAVLVLVAIAAVSASPVLDTVDRSRRAGMRDEIERRLIMARAHAMTTGMPSGVRFDMADQTADAIEIVSSGAAPSMMGMANNDRPLNAMFTGVAITGISLDPADARDAIWFSNEGVPHYRTAQGAFISNLSQDAVITVTGGGVVTVRMESGLIE